MGAVYPDLKGRSVLVTGGGSGIGESIVRDFASQGAKVGFIDINETAGMRVVEAVRAAGGDVHFEKADVCDIAALRQAIDQIRKINGPITILVNNAAHDDRHVTEDVTPEYFDGRIAVNLKHQFFASQAVLPDMKAAGGGSIICMGSTSWMMGLGGMAVYTVRRQAATEAPQFVEVWLAWADLAIEFTDLADAPARLEKAHQLAPENWRVGDAYVRYYIKVKEFDRAEAEARKLADRFEDNRAVQYRLGLTLVANLKPEEAIPFIAKAATYYDPSQRWRPGFMLDENPFVVMARALSETGRSSEAAAALQTFIGGRDQVSIAAEVFADLSTYLEAAGRYDEAMKALEIAIGKSSTETDQLASLKARRAGLMMKASAQSPALREEFITSLRRGDTPAILKTELYLRRYGFGEINLTGKFSEQLLEAITDCHANPECRAGMMNAI